MLKLLAWLLAMEFYDQYAEHMSPLLAPYFVHLMAVKRLVTNSYSAAEASLDTGGKINQCHTRRRHPLANDWPGIRRPAVPRPSSSIPSFHCVAKHREIQGYSLCCIFIRTHSSQNTHCTEKVFNIKKPVKKSQEIWIQDNDLQCFYSESDIRIAETHAGWMVCWDCYLVVVSIFRF